MPRHYHHGLPKRQLLEIQLRDLRELLDDTDGNVLIYSDPRYCPGTIADGVGVNAHQAQQRADLQLLAHWIEAELERV